MTPSVIVHGVRVMYIANGDGPENVMAVHCSSASHTEWSSLTQLLSDRYTVVAPDLIGYGASDRWPEDTPWPPRADVDALVGIADEVQGDIHLVGHSYGASMALDAACFLGDRIASLTLIEPVTFNLLPAHGRTREWRTVASVSRAVQSHEKEGRSAKAAAAYMGFWTGRLRWLFAPTRTKANVLRTVGKVALEFGAMEKLNEDRPDYTRMTAPTLLIFGSRTRKAAIAMVEVLAELLPSSRTEVIRGAGHMSPYSHRDEVNRLIIKHVDGHRRHPADSPGAEV